ncbi:MAG: phospholipase D family protein [Faecalicatena sp.]|uniref:phospholipase D-like domain-containing protein n=1 Tax=Faecalicatena sp. TaxID=2005360 RepID=UPI002584177F|nr:phospholipase D family protein [Faecalicatena sp.]MCI6468226.1 phospholipase D family protein [Faecalicatena sp.]MDY5620480.1 phospholipase D family protein [Lachnospiraceae bacterium]
MGHKRRWKWLKIRYLLLAVLFFVLYVVAGIIISYIRQPKVSREYQESFHPESCYSDTVSTDRACVIEDNEAALEERLRMIGQARERIILSTFDFHADKSGKDVIAALIEAAKRNVKIQILVDGFSALQQMDGNVYFYALSSMDNVEIKIYNRLNLLMPWKSMGRLHDKYLIVDDGLYLLGGRNTYDYFLGDNGYKNYDRDVLVYCGEPDSKESSIHQLEDYFQSVWNLDVCKTFGKKAGMAEKAKVKMAREELEKRWKKLLKEYPVILEKADYIEMTYEVNRITLLSNPTHVYAKEPTLFYSLTQLMKQAQEEVAIHTPYIICNDWMYDSLKEVCSENKKVLLMTNSVANNGNPFGASDYQKNKGKLLKTGLEIHEYEGGVSYHGKSITIDDELAIVGSFNMDMRSAYLDTELMLVIDSRDVARQLRGYMQSYEEDSVEALPDGSYHVPDGVARQKISKKREQRVKLLTLFNWFRFLM